MMILNKQVYQALKYTYSQHSYTELFADSAIQNGYRPAHIFLQRGLHME